MSSGRKLKAGDILTFRSQFRWLYDENGRCKEEQIGESLNAIFLGEVIYLNAIRKHGIKVLTAKGICWQLLVDFLLSDQERMTNLEEFWKLRTKPPN